MKPIRQLFAVALLLLVPMLTSAHEVRPGFLEITSEDSGYYEVLWKVPMRGASVLSIHPVFPPECSDRLPVSRRPLPGVMLERRNLYCGEEGLAGKTISINGLSTTLTDVLVRLIGADGQIQSIILKPGHPSFTVTGVQAWPQIAADYINFGIEHILLGIDHLLFVLCLLVIVRGAWRLVKTITAFTLAHSITLALATLGFVHVPQAPVESAIALSIVFLATEILHARKRRCGLTCRFPWLVAFVFGLLHGLGFAGALSELGLPQTDIPLTLLSFNVGVELGQLLFVFLVLALRRAIRKLDLKRIDWAEPVSAYAIGIVASFWLIQRVTAMFVMA